MSKNPCPFFNRLNHNASLRLTIPPKKKKKNDFVTWSVHYPRRLFSRTDYCFLWTCSEEPAAHEHVRGTLQTFNGSFRSSISVGTATDRRIRLYDCDWDASCYLADEETHSGISETTWPDWEAVHQALLRALGQFPVRCWPESRDKETLVQGFILIWPGKEVGSIRIECKKGGFDKRGTGFARLVQTMP